jgi:hypothetical protein
MDNVGTGVKDDTVMTRLIHSLKLERTRHVLRGGQRARQIAGLLGFDAHQQSAISAAVFAIAYKGVADLRPAKLRFFLSDDRLLVQCQSASEDQAHETESSAQSSRGNPSGESPNTIKWRPTVLGDLALGPELLVLSFPLPAGSPRLDLADLPWVIREMGRITPLDALEEFYFLNRELLRLLRLTNVTKAPPSRGGHAA